MFAQTLLRRSVPTGARAFSTSPAHALARMQIIGRMGTKPEAGPTSTGKEIIRYSIASEYGPATDRQTSWFRVASFAEGPRKDFLLSLDKGTLIHLDADARMGVYEDESGNKRAVLNLVQRDIEVLRRPAPKEDGEQAAKAEAA